jgi:hypothetical protein
MTEVAPYATDHDDDSRRTASSSCYDLPNQDNKDDNSIITAFISEIAPSYLNTINKMITYINEDYTMYFNEWEDDLPECNDETFLPDGLRMAFGIIENILDEVTRYMNQEFMNEKEIKPLKDRERRRREKCERIYQQKTESQRTTSLINNTALLTKTIKANVDIPTQSNDISLVSCNLHSNRTLKAIKTPLPSSLERATNLDANFDRDNPLLSTMAKSPPPSSSSINDTKLRPSSNKNDFDRDNPSLLPLILPASSNALPLSINNNNGKNNNELDPYNIISPPPSPKDIKLKQVSSSSAPQLQRNSNNMNGLYNNNFVTDKNNFVTDKINPSNALEASMSPNALPPPSEPPLLTSIKIPSNVVPPSPELDSDANFDRDNPSINSKVGISTQSKNIPSVSDRTVNNTKSPPLERVINSDANFDRDNPSSLPLILPVYSITPPLSNNKNNITNVLYNNNVTDTGANATPELPLLQSIKPLSEPPSSSIKSLRSSCNTTNFYRDNFCQRQNRDIFCQRQNTYNTTNFDRENFCQRQNREIFCQRQNTYNTTNFDRDNFCQRQNIPTLSTTIYSNIVNDNILTSSNVTSGSKRVANIKSPSSNNDNKLQQQAFNELSPSSELTLLNDVLTDRTPNNIILPTPSPKDIKVQHATSSNALPLLSNNNSNNNKNNNNASNTSKASISPNALPPSSVPPSSVPPSSEPPSLQLQSAKPTPLASFELSSNQSPSLDNINNNVLNQNNNNINEVLTTVPVTTSRTPATVAITRKVNVIKIPGMIHTTKYDVTSTRSKISFAHGEAPSTRSKFSITHEDRRTQ